MNIGMLQLNFKIGDFEGNFDKIIQGYQECVTKGADLVVTSELALFGYPPGDMLLRDEYITRQNLFLNKLMEKTGTVGLIVGIVTQNKEIWGLPLYNSAVLIHSGEIVFTRHKSLLPNYDVFSERRYFQPFYDTCDEKSIIVTYKGKTITILVCEDIWGLDKKERKIYSNDPVDHLKKENIDILITINASPFYSGKLSKRLDIAKSLSKSLACSFVYVNQVGGNDELIFDGTSFVLNNKGKLLSISEGFREDIRVCNVSETNPKERNISDDIKNLHDALIMGTRDYVLKATGNLRVTIGLSGGIDSALCAAIAVKALGPENVFGYGMPSDFSSRGSVDDARALSENLSISFDVIPIKEIYQTFGKTVAPVINWDIPGKLKSDVTEENVQARLRGAILMSISNRCGGIVLSTGNKSELSLGYSTLYGDMCGGYGILSDITKTKVYELSRYINISEEIIPWNSINKEPSAELRPDQKDTDSLPPYDILDPILEAYIEKGLSGKEIGDLGFDKEIVKWVISRVNQNEFKRRQMAPGLKVTEKAYGSGRRVPIAACF